MRIPVMSRSKASAQPTASITDPQLLTALHDRASKDQTAATVATRDLARYYRLLREQLATIALSEGEAMLIYRALESARTERFPSLVEAVTAEAERQLGFSDMREVDTVGMLRRLRALTLLQTLALIDALERFDARIQRNGWGDIQTVLRAVGVRVR
jgi:hypothetical protein